MTTETIQWGTLVVEVATLIVAAVGLPLVLVALSHARSANFISAWLSISDRLQCQNILRGRVLLRCLYESKNGEEASDEEIMSAFEKARTTYSQNDWWKSLEEEVNEQSSTPAKANWLRGVMAEAVGEFDLISILAIHSRIPGLLDVVVLEWLDNIIACYEQGRWVVCRRITGGRYEQFQCFSVLYIRALDRREQLTPLGPGLVGDPYPAPPTLWARLADRQLRRDANAAARKRKELCAGTHGGHKSQSA